MLFFGTKSFLGVDIGTTSIKMVEIANAEKKPTLRNYGWLETYGYLERLNDAIQTSSLRILEKDASKLLQFLISQIKPKTNNVVASLPSFAAFITLVELPVMTPEDTAKAVVFQARQYIPLPVSEITLDWLKVGERETEEGAKKQQILLTSVPNERIRSYRSIFKAAGLRLVALEIESFSLSRALVNSDPTPTILVDIGGRSTNIAVVDKGFWKYNGRTDFAGGSLTQAIASSVNIDVRRAEELKKRVGLLGAGGEYELSTLMFPYLDVIIDEVRRVRESYEKEYQGKIERIILAGGGANLLGIENRFTERLGLPVVKGAPFNKISYPPQLEATAGDLGPSLAVAIGLGVREFLK
ncbi:MAG: type IV pilus assembly protein PilM [Candidatus Paceibacterota bacterium]